MGFTQKALGEAQREVLSWTRPRLHAVHNRRGLYRGWGIAWTRAGYAEFVPCDVPRPGKRDVTVVVDSSAVSPGTERAQYLRLPNARVGSLGRPGYSAAGVVLATGRHVEHLQPGDRVAVVRAPHASVVTVPAVSAYRVPDGVELADASFIRIGEIAAFGVALAGLSDREPFAVIGAGLIGQLAIRIGARVGDPRLVVAASRSKEALARGGGARDFISLVDSEGVLPLEVPVVIEATGDPSAIVTAIALAQPGGRVVLLGSSRGITRAFDFGQIRHKRLTLIGAHIANLDRSTSQASTPRASLEAASFLDALADGSIEVADLVDAVVDPRESALFYRRLADDRSLVGARFDWSVLPDEERVRSGHLLRPPHPLARGTDAARPLSPRRRARSTTLHIADPLEGVVGHVRFGMLGCGDIGVRNARGLAMAPNAELTACFDPNAELARDLATRHGARALRSDDALLEDPEVDAVVISAPHDLHAPLAIKAAAAGKHVVVEKPLAESLSSAKAILQAAQDAHVTVSVCFPQRYEPAVAVAHRLVRSGALGEFTGSSVVLYLDKTPSYWRGGSSGRAHSDWRSSRERAGGGVLIMNLTHHLDLMRYVSGIDFEVVGGLTAATEPPTTVEDTVAIAVRYANGALGSVAGHSAARGTAETEISFWGRDGRLTIEPRARVYSLRPLPGLQHARWTSFGRLPAVDIRAVYFARLAHSIATSSPPEVTGADGLAVQAAIEGAYRAQGDGRSIPVAELLNVSAPDDALAR